MYIKKKGKTYILIWIHTKEKEKRKRKIMVVSCYLRSGQEGESESVGAYLGFLVVRRKAWWGDVSRHDLKNSKKNTVIKVGEREREYLRR